MRFFLVIYWKISSGIESRISHGRRKTQGVVSQPVVFAIFRKNCMELQKNKNAFQ